MKSIYENTSKGYTQQGDYVLPNIEIEDKAEYNIGVWGQRYRKHLYQNHRVLYYNYLTLGTLYKHISEVEIQAENLFASVVKSLTEKENVTENLKAESPMEWVQKMNNIRNRATEIVNTEVIFV